MSRRQQRQGFSIEELQAGALSEDDDEEDSEFDIGIDGEDDDDMNQGKASAMVGKAGNAMSDVSADGEDDDLFLDETMDAKNEKWVQTHFEQDHKGEKIAICCPSCFTPVSYLSKPQGTVFVATKVVNCVVKPSSVASSKDDPVFCAECGSQVGKRTRHDRLYSFNGVLPSTTADQL